MKLHVLDKVMTLHRLFKKPAMTFWERRLLKEVLLSFRSEKSFKVFEYGSGFSTLYYTQFLRKHNINFQWHSIDNHSGWHQAVGQMITSHGLQDHVTLHLSEFTPFWEKPNWDPHHEPSCGQLAPSIQAELDYIQKPQSLKLQFDFMIMDGRFRRRCLQLAPSCLSKNGVVFLHDAQNKKYHEPLKEYSDSLLLDGGKFFPFEQRGHQIWFGTFNNVDVMDKVRKHHQLKGVL